MTSIPNRSPQTAVRIREAGPGDAETLVRLIHELAVYERMADEARPSVDRLRAHLADGAHPRCEAFLAEHDETGEAVGFALYFFNYSTFLTRWGVHLEDLYVQPAYRGRGVGYALLRSVAAAAVEHGCERMEWAVLDWNELALSFYRKLGAKPMDDWTTMRLSGDALRTVGAPT